MKAHATLAAGCAVDTRGPSTGPHRSHPAVAAKTHGRRIQSHEILGGAVEIEIAHESQIYRLRRTSLGKLILTK